MNAPSHNTLRAVDSIKIGKRHRRDMGDIDGLAKSISEMGLMHPIVISKDNMLIAGERRLTAVKQLGWKDVRVTVLDLDIGELVLGEQAENIDRKDFTVEERVAIARAIEDLVGERRGRPSKGKVENFPQLTEGKTRDFVAQKAGFRNSKTYEQAKAVVAAAEAEPEKFSKAKADMNRTGRVNGPYKRVKVAWQAIAIRAEPPPLPSKGPYRVIVADPPWPYEVRKEDPSHRAAHPYPQMSIAEICAFGAANIAHEDCVLWLWTTNSHMHESYAVLDAWGFQWKTILTWAKDRMGTGDWLRGQTEHCHMAVRGKPTVQLTNQTTLLRAPMRANSQKPDEFYELVEALCPAPRYTYLFSRNSRDRWDCHGDEVPAATSTLLRREGVR
jgi:N6-adenosine-specific RNA methylase IME4